jgi:formylmethanofuran dehydrogenase subunit E
MQPQFLVRRSTGRIVVCPQCREPYPAADGSSCRACQGEAPYVAATKQPTPTLPDLPPLTMVPVEEAVGRLALHDMTHIVPGVSKGPAFHHGQEIKAGDLCRLQHMGRYHVYVADQQADLQDWVHEDEAALAFAQALAGPGVNVAGPAREGKINLRAERDGLLLVDRERLLQFNLVAGVMCAGRQGFRVVREGHLLAGTRAIPLYLARGEFNRALGVLQPGPVYTVQPLRRASVGILVTGTEIFQGLIQDKFAPIIQTKVEQLGSRVLGVIIAPDTREAIRQGVKDLLAKGIDLLVTTAGLSVDPDDVTRQGLQDAGAADLLYGAPIIPGAMTLLAHIGNVQVMGVPACALYFKHTSFDLLLPRLLAGLTLTRQDLAAMGHGAICLECPTCTFPSCSFGC